MNSGKLRPNTRGGDTWTVLLLTLCNLIVPVVAYIWGIVRLSQTDRWNKIQKLGLVLILPVLFLVPALIFAATRSSKIVDVREEPLPVRTPATQPSGQTVSTSARLPLGCKPNGDPSEVSKDFGPLTGTTHVGVVSNNTWNYTISPPEVFGDQSKWGGNKLLIAVHRSAGPAVTVTGHLLDDPKVELRFGNDPEPVRSRILRLSDTKELDGGWYDFPNAIRAQKIGCYQLRFKSDRLDEVVTLRIVPSQ
jgi:hypothetical protein